MLKQTIALVGITLSLSSHAAILDLGTITRDTSTGLDWLDVTETINLSYNQVTAQMGAGGDYEEYRYATMSELDQLIMNFGYTAVNQNCSYTALHCDTGINGDSALIEYMIKTLGDTYQAYSDSQGVLITSLLDGAGYTHGILGSQQRTSGKYDVGAILDNELVWRDGGGYYSDDDDVVLSSHSAKSGTYHLLSMGSFLVAPSAVPIPAAGWLFGSALIGLVGMKRKKYLS